MKKDGISFVGAGRVASALSQILYRYGNSIDLIVSESEKSCRSLAESCQAHWSTEPEFPDTTSIIVVSVPDHKLKSVLHTLKCSPETLVVHTAGSFGLDVFPERIERKGVFYPLQTFSYGRNISFINLPFFIESSDNASDTVLENLALSTGGRVYFSDTKHRRELHLAAIFACNFTNYMLSAGKELSSRAGFQFDVLRPLIEETILKALENGPENSQTGPAIRNDINTIEKHLELLSFSPELKKLYSVITRSILNYYNKK